MGETQRSRVRIVASVCAPVALLGLWWLARGAQEPGATRPREGLEPSAAQAGASRSLDALSEPSSEPSPEPKALAELDSAALAPSTVEPSTSVAPSTVEPSTSVTPNASVSAARATASSVGAVGDVSAQPRVSASAAANETGAGAQAVASAELPGDAKRARQRPNRGRGRAEAGALWALCKESGDAECARWMRGVTRPHTGQR
jgi:cytoskeletal protein RodZ